MPANQVQVTIQLHGSQAFVSQANASATSVSGIGNAAQDSGKKASKFGSLLKSGMAVGAVGIGALAAGAKSAFDAFEESRKVTAQTGAVVKSTGGAAKVTATQVADLAGALSKKTGMDDELIQSGSNVLLTFSKIRNEAGKGNDIFNQTTSIMADMSAALGQDTKSSAMQLGKALNNPVKGVAALQRVGVAFTESQKKEIAGLVKHGKTLDAQKIILKELNSEFGGSAAAQATASDKMKVAWGNMMESIGGALAPLIDSALPSITKAIDTVGPKIETFFSQMRSGEGAGGKVASAIGTMVSVLKKLADAVGFVVKNWQTFAAILAIITPLVIALTAKFLIQQTVLLAYTIALKAMEIWTKAVTVAQWLWNAALTANPIGLVVAAIIALGIAVFVAYKKVDWFRAAVDKAFAWILTAVKNVWNWVKQNWPLLLAILTGPFGLAVYFIKKNFGKIVDFIKGIPGKIGSAASGMFDGIKDAFKSAINWVIGKWNSLEFKIGGQKVFGKTLPSVTIGTPDIPLLAAGGTIATGGAAIVGERGPELVRLPPAAQVVPNSALAGAAQQTIVTQVFLDRRQIAEAIGTYTADRIARR